MVQHIAPLPVICMLEISCSAALIVPPERAHQQNIAPPQTGATDWHTAHVCHQIPTAQLYDMALPTSIPIISALHRAAALC
jgi:hypothetical protein